MFLQSLLPDLEILFGVSGNFRLIRFQILLIFLYLGRPQLLPLLDPGEDAVLNFLPLSFGFLLFFVYFQFHLFLGHLLLGFSLFDIILCLLPPVQLPVDAVQLLGGRQVKAVGVGVEDPLLVRAPVFAVFGLILCFAHTGIRHKRNSHDVYHLLLFFFFNEVLRQLVQRLPGLLVRCRSQRRHR